MARHRTVYRSSTDKHDAEWLVRTLRDGALREFQSGCSRTARVLLRDARVLQDETVS